MGSNLRVTSSSPLKDTIKQNYCQNMKRDNVKRYIHMRLDNPWMTPHQLLTYLMASFSTKKDIMTFKYCIH